MSKSLKEKLFECRRVLENPYAHIEHLEAIEAEREQPTLDLQIHKSRKLLENPYAYLAGSGGYSGVTEQGDSERSAQSTYAKPSTPKADRTRRRYSDQQIEALTKDLHTRLWREKESLWDGIPPSDPIELLDPAVALHLIGFEYSLEEGLGKFRGSGGYIEVAGLIDRASRRVHGSRQFPMDVRNFTVAHELGHAVLHQAGGGIHRDRPLDGASLSREPDEIEADKFATYFLMPAKLVRTRFASLFGTDFFELNDDTAFALSGKGVDEVSAQCRTRRDLSRLLADVKRYNSRHFVSLAEQFRVSVGAMAIRLEELELLA